jgi:hypothetical protein
VVALREITLPLADDYGRVVTALRIVPRRWDSAPSPLIQVDAAETREWGEERFQLLEGATYDYELRLTGPSQRLREGMFQRGGLSDAGIERGTISPRAWTGLLPVVLEDGTGDRLAAAALEIRSSKLAYRTDYRDMLEFIAEKSIDLLFDLRAPSLVRLSPRSNSSPSSVAQRFSFARHFVSSRDFRDAIARIVKFPHDRTVLHQEEQSSRRSFCPTAGLIRQVAGRQPRIALPESHPLCATLGSLPLSLSLPQPTRILDTPENRFVKYALMSFEVFFEDLERELAPSKRPEDIRLKREIGLYRAQMAEILSHSFFHAVSEARLLPLGSSILQRRPGYREVLNAWLKFHLAAILDWSGGDDVYGGGKRDVATLYEYWIFFQLLQLLTKQFSLPVGSLAPLVERTGDRFGLKLKSGTHVSIDGVFKQGPRSFRVKFSFNRTFLRLAPPAAESSYPAAGSWTRRMRPDYTLSLWPSAYEEAAAEHENSIVHLHFDAKYRVDSLSEFFGDDDDASLEDATRARKEGRTAKRDDLLKMHAYRDAIRRSEGAYVLYPGTENIKWRGYHELLPGLGAFAISPNDERGLRELSIFIEDAIRELSRKTSQREETAYQIHRIHESLPDESMPVVPFPETDATGVRLPPPSEELVLICGRVQPNTSETIRETSRVFLLIQPGDPLLRFVNVQYVLVSGNSDASMPQLWRVRPNDCQLADGNEADVDRDGELRSPDTYLVYQIDPAGPEADRCRWSLQSLAALGISENSAEPVVLSLDRLWSLAADVGVSSTFEPPGAK